MEVVYHAGKYIGWIGSTTINHLARRPVSLGFFFEVVLGHVAEYHIRVEGHKSGWASKAITFDLSNYLGDFLFILNNPS